jgi:hypothetical protein
MPDLRFNTIQSAWVIIRRFFIATLIPALAANQSFGFPETTSIPADVRFVFYPSYPTIMRPKILAIGVVILALWLILILLKTKHRQASDLSERNLPAGIQPASQPEQSKITKDSQSVILSNDAISSGSSVSNAIEDLRQQQLIDWQRPIEFYGKVVDENTNPVAGASITFAWSETPTKEGEMKSSTLSDAEGQFSLRGKHGPSLEVWFTKDGYYASHRGQMGFSYYHGDFSPDPQNPVIFVLRKKGTPEPLIHVAGVGLRTMRDYLLAADGKPTEVSLRDGRLSSPGQGDLKVEFKAGPGIERFPSRITWQCRVTIPGGGLVQTDEEFPFLAPESGYQEFDQWNISATNWTETLDKQYFLKLRDGSFGRATLRVKAGASGNSYFRMESFLNPSGSRILEPDR